MENNTLWEKVTSEKLKENLLMAQKQTSKTFFLSSRLVDRKIAKI
jgi:hypothetical protein